MATSAAGSAMANADILPVTGTVRLTATPAAAATAPATSPASDARPTPRTASGPQIRRVAMTSGTATTLWPMVLPRARAATTRRGGASSARITSATMTSSQLPARAAAAILSRPMANITLDKLMITAAPATPGANTANASISSGTWPGCLASTCAADTLIAAITAVPSQDISSTARVDPAQVRSKTGPSRADSTVNALTTMDRASTAEIELNTCEA